LKWPERQENPIIVCWTLHGPSGELHRSTGPLGSGF